MLEVLFLFLALGSLPVLVYMVGKILEHFDNDQSEAGPKTGSALR